MLLRHIMHLFRIREKIFNKKRKTEKLRKIFSKTQNSKTTNLKRNNQRNLNCDTLIVGGGPYNIVLAINKLLKGQQVLIVDEENQLGGAWSPKPCFNEIDRRYDCVAHLLSPYQGAIDLLKRTGFELIKRPIFFWVNELTQQIATSYQQFSDDTFDPLLTKAGLLVTWHQWHGLKELDKGINEAKSSMEAHRWAFENFFTSNTVSNR